PETMACDRQPFADQLSVLVCQASIRQPLERATPDSRRQHTAAVQIASIRGSRRVIRSSVRQLNRSTTRGRDLPYLPGTHGIRIKEHPRSRDQDGTSAPPGMATSFLGSPPALMSQISLLPDALESKAISRLSGDHAGWNGRRDCAAS